MGNSLGSKKTVKIMKVSGETFKRKTPVKAGEVLKDYPTSYVLLESENVKHYGIRAKPLELHQDLEPKMLYFLVDLPKFPEETKVARRVRSGIQMSAKDKLESLKLTRRSTSDLSLIKPTSMMVESLNGGLENGTTRVKMMLPKAEVSRLMQESKDGDEVAQKIFDLCLAKTREGDGGGGDGAPLKNRVQQLRCEAHKVPQKRVSFGPRNEGEIEAAVAY